MATLLSTYAPAYRGNANVAGTGEATYHPAGIYSTGTNWLYGTMYLNVNSINDTGDIRTYNSSYHFRARYNAGNDNYHASLNWYGLQLGNNGDNYIVGGRTNPGGNLRFYVNNTTDFTNINGTLSAIMHANGRTTFGNTTDYGYTLNVAGSFYATDWIRVGGSQGLYFESYGGGFRMTDSTWVRIYNDKNLYTGGTIQAGRFEDANNTNFFADPSGESVFSRLNVGGTSHTYENSEAVIKLANTVDAHNYIVSNSNAWNSWNQWIRYIDGYNTWRIGTFDDQQESGYSLWRLAGKNREANGELNYIVAGPRGAWGDNDRVVLWNPVSRYDGGSYNGDGSHYHLLPEDKWWNSKYFASGGEIYATRFYDSSDGNYYCDPASTSRLNKLNDDGGDTYGYKYFYSNVGSSTYIGAGNAPCLQTFSTDNGPAFMAFHRSGQYAVNFGLDPDNVLRVGGWSAASNRMQLDMSGNVTFAGDVTAYSDARVKENVHTIENALYKTLQLRGVTYNRTDSDDKSTKIGVIAQEVLEVIPQVVNQDASGMYNVSYGNLTAVLIEAIKEQQKQIDELKEIINGLTR